MYNDIIVIYRKFECKLGKLIKYKKKNVFNKLAID